MLWLARGLSADPNANPDLQRVLRMNLSAFERRLNSLREILPHSSGVRVMAFSPDGKLLAIGGGEGTVRLWDSLSGQAKGELRQHKAPIRALAFSSDSQTLLSGSEDQTAQLWRLASGRPEGPPFIHDELVLAVAFTSDANTILTATGKGAFQWDRGTRKSRDFAFSAKKPARMVAFSPDGKRVLQSDSGSTR